METLRGSIWMVVAMAGFALEDMFLKAAATDLSAGAIMIFFGLAGMAAFALMARAQGQPVWHPGFGTRPMALRSLSEVVGRLGFTLAIVFTPISSASAILQATPLVVTAGAVLFFGEQVGWRRWLAIGVGFTGVLLILRPGLDGFELASLFAVVGMLGFAGRDLATRAAPQDMSNAQLGVLGFAMIVIAGAIAQGFGGGAIVPTQAAALALAVATGFGVFAYTALSAAMRQGEIGAIAPFRHTRLIFAMTIGILIFGERPDALTLLGSAVIVGSGLFTLLRGRRVQRA